MSALALAPAARRRASVGQLGAVEALRLLRHPVYLAVGVPFMALQVAVVLGIAPGYDTEGAFDASVRHVAYWLLLVFVLLVLAPLTAVSVYRVATATRRSAELLDATPVQHTDRTIAIIVGLLRGPVLAGVAVMIVMDLIGIGLGAVEAADGLNGQQALIVPQSVLGHLQLPIVVLGAGLVGIAAARWLAVPGGAVLTFLLLYLVMSSLSRDETMWFNLWPAWWDTTNGGMLPRHPTSQELWHLAYLLGMAGLAGTAALLRDHTHRRRALGLAVVLAAAAVVVVIAGWRQAA